jgi:hypothetical protein
MALFVFLGVAQGSWIWPKFDETHWHAQLRAQITLF